MLTNQQGQALVRLARQQIERHLGADSSPEGAIAADQLHDDPVIAEKRGVFVTLHRNNQLRGCIGSLAAVEALGEGIRRNALNAAFHDYRFPSLTAAELPGLKVEVSILTEPQPLVCSSPDEVLSMLRPGVDGVIIKGPHGEQATFLPQVWQQLPQPEQFLGHLCRKASLPEQAWRSGTLRFFTYQVQSFEESR